MSIDSQIASITFELSRIAEAVEKLAGTGIPAPGPQPAPPFGPDHMAAIQTAQELRPAPMPTPQAPFPAPAPAPMGPVGVPTPIPSGPAPMPTGPVGGVTLDDIRAAANDFHRAHPDRATEIMNILNGVQVQKIDQIQPQFYQHVYDSIRHLGA